KNAGSEKLWRSRHTSRKSALEPGQVHGPPFGARVFLFANAGSVSLRLRMKKSLCASTAALALVVASAMLAPGVAADLNIAPIYNAPPAVATWAGCDGGVGTGGAARQRDRRRADGAHQSQRRHHRHDLGLQHPERQLATGLRGRHL